MSDREDEDYIDLNRVREALDARPGARAIDPMAYDPPNPDPSYACGMRATCEADSAEIGDLRRALEDAEKTLQTLTDQRDEALGEAQQYAEDCIVLLDRYATLRAAMVEGVIEAGRLLAALDAALGEGR